MKTNRGITVKPIGPSLNIKRTETLQTVTKAVEVLTAAFEQINRGLTYTPLAVRLFSCAPGTGADDVLKGNKQTATKAFDPSECYIGVTN